MKVHEAPKGAIIEIARTHFGKPTYYGGEVVYKIALSQHPLPTRDGVRAYIQWGHGREIRLYPHAECQVLPQEEYAHRFRS